MFKAIMEVKQATGTVRSGISKAGKPWKMADQQVAFHVDGQDFPVVGLVDIFCPRDATGVPQDPTFLQAGRYEVPVKLVVGEFGRIAAVVDVRGAFPMSPQAVKPKAA